MQCCLKWCGPVFDFTEKVFFHDCTFVYPENLQEYKLPAVFSGQLLIDVKLYEESLVTFHLGSSKYKSAEQILAEFIKFLPCYFGPQVDDDGIVQWYVNRDIIQQVIYFRSFTQLERARFLLEIA